MKRFIIGIILLFASIGWAADKYPTARQVGMQETTEMVLFNAVTATGTSDTYHLPGYFKLFTATTILTGSPLVILNTLQGSADGVTWATLDANTSTSDDVAFIKEKAVSHIRAVYGNFSGGSTPTLTMKVIGVNY
jgi:hypothetical protein